MQKSECENFLAVISGKNLIKKEQKVNQLFIFKRAEGCEFALFKRIIVKDLAIFDKVCMQFYFTRVHDSQAQPKSLIFVKRDRILKLDYIDNSIDTIYEFKNPLNKQPEFFQMNDS